MRIRDIPAGDFQKLEGLAARHGVTVEEYALWLITEAVSDDAAKGEPSSRRDSNGISGKRDEGEVTGAARPA